MVFGVRFCIDVFSASLSCRFLYLAPTPTWPHSSPFVIGMVSLHPFSFIPHFSFCFFVGICTYCLCNQSATLSLPVHTFLCPWNDDFSTVATRGNKKINPRVSMALDMSTNTKKGLSPVLYCLVWERDPYIELPGVCVSVPAWASQHSLLHPGIKYLDT